MSLTKESNIKQKKFVYPKEPKKNIKSFDNSSKSTRATSKNIIPMKSLKFVDKIEYFDLFSDLIYSRQGDNNVPKKYPKEDSEEFSINKYIPKKYPKEDSEESSNNSSLNFEKEVFKKKKKCFSHKKAKVKFIKYFKEDGEAVNFPLFNERDIKIDEYDNKVKIESAEDDFASDESTLDYGKKKVEKDLIEAFALIKKENINCLVNYKKFGKYIKKPKKKLDLRKNLPFIPPVTKK